MVIMTIMITGIGGGQSLSVVEAKAQFARCLRVAESGTPIVVTRHGKPVVALVPASDLEQLQRLHAAGPSGGLASVATGWTGSDELVRNVLASRRTRARRASRLR